LPERPGSATLWLMESSGSSTVDSLVGRTLAGKYDVLALLGTGGMGAVFKGRHRDLGTNVALKVLLSDEPEYVLRFEREAASIAAIDHRCVVRVLDFGRDATGLPFLAMEHVDGVDLRALVESQGALPLERVVSLGADILAGLAVVHDVGIVHRDLKPGNVLLTKTRDDDGRLIEHAKICDFGIASFHGEAASSRGSEAITRTGYVVGTPEYMAPEQALGRGATPQSDLYAVGVLLFELATGSRPFRGATPVEVAVQHVSAEIPLASRRAALPASFDAFCMRAMCKEPAGRQSDARSMRRELLAILTASATSPSVATVATAPLAPAARNANVRLASTNEAVALPSTPEPSDVDDEPPLLAPTKRASAVPMVVGALVLVVGGAFASAALRDDEPAPNAKAAADRLTVAATGASARPSAAPVAPPPSPPDTASTPVHSTPTRALVVRSTDIVEPAQGGVRVAAASPKSGPLAAGGDARSGIAPATLPNTAPTLADALHEIRHALGSVTRVQAGQGLAESDVLGQADRAKKSLERCAMGAAAQLSPGNLGEMTARLVVSPEGKVIGVTFDDGQWPSAARTCAQRALLGLYLPHALPTATGATVGLGLVLD
jgi:serine/threonine protein kinase